MIRRARSLSVLVALAAGALGLIGSTQTWFTVLLHETPDAPLAVSGAAALPVLAPLCLAALALGAALSIAGRALAYAIGALTLAVGAVLVVLVFPIAVQHPVSAVAPTVTTATGIDGRDAVTALIASITATPWPLITTLPACALVLIGVLILATTHRWRSSGRRYRTDAAARQTTDADVVGDGGAEPLDAIDSWDDLSHGTDPTSQR